MFWGLNTPRSIDAGRRNKGRGEKGKSMAEWNPAAIELFQLTLAEEKKGGDSKTLPACPLTSFIQKFQHFYCHFTLISQPVSFSIFLLS